MKSYKHLFFDLDHTLWDYDTNASETLFELYDKYDLDKLGVEGAVKFRDIFFRENNKLWAEMDAGRIDKFYLRNNRFRIVLTKAQADMSAVTESFLKEINHFFLTVCSKKTQVIKGAFELLDYCRGKYDLHIITNGFEEVQATKLAHSGLDVYFGQVITSERAGHKKPNPGIYHYALKHTQAQLDYSLMIGDNLQTDIKGARDFGMDQVYFNPMGQKHDEKVTREISELTELMELLSA